MTRDEAVQRGQEAARLLEHEILVEAFAAIEADALEALVSARPDDDVTRRHEALRIAVVRDVRQQLRSVITTGKLAVAEGKARR